MSAPISPKILARAMADATLIGDRKAAKKHGISYRTIETNRAKLDPSSPLAFELQRVLNDQDLSWSGGIPDVLQAGYELLFEAIKQCDPSEMSTIVKLSTEILIPLSETMMSREIIRAQTQTPSA